MAAIHSSFADTLDLLLVVSAALALVRGDLFRLLSSGPGTSWSAQQPQPAPATAEPLGVLGKMNEGPE